MVINYYVVGGYVRDQLIGLQSKDIDIAVEAISYEAMKEDLIRQDVRIFLESPQYYTIRGTHKDLGAVDYVLCRKDGLYSDARHPDSVSYGSIYDDLARRDFTINAIAINMQTNEFLDPHNGSKDLESKILRTVGKAHERFEEDALRILRGLRFAIKYDLEIEQDTLLAMKKLSPSVIKTLPEERIREELRKTFSHNTVKAIKLLDELKLLEPLFNKKQFSLWLEPTVKK